MTGHNQLRRSRTRLQRQGALWLDQTRQAGETFIVESQEAGRTFAQDMTSAGTKLASSVKSASQRLQQVVYQEAIDWRDLALKTRDGYIEAWKAQLGRLEQQASTTRDALKPETVEATVLESARDLLELAHEKVDQRLEQSSKAAKPAATKSRKKQATKSRAKAKKPQKAASSAPIRDYDELTAKDVASKIQRLSGPQAAAVLDYERARKKRATVIRAAEQRLAAAS